MKYYNIGMVLVDMLKQYGVLNSKSIIEAFEAVDRVDFLPPDQKLISQSDRPIPIGHGQTNSQPYTVAFMLELLQVQPGDKILDVGSGSGWTTTLLAHMASSRGSVIGVELVPELAEMGQKNLAKYSHEHAVIKQATTKLGWSEQAPYDRILVSAEAQEIPEELISQLKAGGVMVVPVDRSILKITKNKKLEIKEYPGFVFVPLISRYRNTLHDPE